MPILVSFQGRYNPRLITRHRNVYIHTFCRPLITVFLPVYISILPGREAGKVCLTRSAKNRRNERFFYNLTRQKQLFVVTSLCYVMRKCAKYTILVSSLRYLKNVDARTCPKTSLRVSYGCAEDKAWGAEGIDLTMYSYLKEKDSS